MKKIFYSIFVLVLTLIVVNPLNVKANYCWERSSASECNNGQKRTDDAGNTCQWTGGHCEVSKYACNKKKYCTCYNADNCPDRDDYGNYCYATGTSCSLYKSYTVIDEDDDVQTNYDASGDVSCGNGLTFNKSIANVTHYMVWIFQILGPVMLIILGMIDLTKAVTRGNEDEIKKAQSIFFKRLLVGVLLFFVIMIVRMLISLLSTNTILDCFDCFVNGANRCH